MEFTGAILIRKSYEKKSVGGGIVQKKDPGPWNWTGVLLMVCKVIAG
jgi:hypothetical protein